MYLKFLVVALTISVSSVSCFPEGRVVNGTDSDITKYPFMASLRSYGSHSCGCSIIDTRWVLTAAHCVDFITLPLTLSVQYGSTTIGSSGGNTVGVKRIFVHENYSPWNSYANDIALLELSSDVIFNDKTVGKVTLPEPNFEIPQTSTGTPGVLIGWGYEMSGGSVQKTLQEVVLKIYSDEQCSAAHGSSVTTHQICGGVDEGGKGQCSGDSGGPLLLQENSVQVGIVSWSVKPCTIKGYPGVYTKVSHYVDWIYEKMNK